MRYKLLLENDEDSKTYKVILDLEDVDGKELY